MLNFFSMIRSASNFIVLSFLWLSSWMQATIIDKPEIVSPKSGETLQGIVTIDGSTDLIGFQSYELLFAYAIDETDTWFLIQQGSEMVNNGTLGTWDTTTITDGIYRLILRVYMDDFTTSDTIITGLRVRNYTPIETSIPEASSIIEGSVETQIIEASPPVTISQELPSNPALISSQGVLTSIVKAVIFSVLALLVIGGLILFRTISRRK